MLRLENIVGSAVNSRLGRFLLASAVAATMYACDGRTEPMPTIEPTRPAPTATAPLPAPTPDIAAIAGDAVYDGNTLKLTGRIENINGDMAKGVEVVANINGFQKVLYVIPTLAKGSSYEVSSEIDASSINYKVGDPITLVARLPDINGQTDPNAGNNTAPYTKIRDMSNSYDFAKSLGLEASYLKDVAFDNNSKGLITYFASLPSQMRTIAERSGLLEDILNDNKVDAKEAAFFNNVIGSYQKEIETMRPWLSLPEKDVTEADVTAALALNLRNFIEGGYLKNERVPSLLSPAIFFADGVKRMYAAEINDPVGWRSSPKKVYISAMVDNITNFSEIQKKAWGVANDSQYDIFVGENARRHFEIEAVGSTDKGLNAYEDISLLVREGSPEAKAALRIYGRNFVEGNNGSAEQVRVEMTQIYLWNIGIPSHLVILDGHDVPTIPLTLEDITLLKSRSMDPLLVIDINGSMHLPFQWTRTNKIRPDVTYFTIPDGIGRKEIKVAELKPY